MKPETFVKLVGGGVVALIGLIFLFSSFYTIDAGQRGIILSWGEVTGIADPGLNFKMPIRDKIIEADVTTQIAEAPAEAGTKDLQSVSTKVAVNYRLDDSKLDIIYSTVGGNIEGKIIDPRIQEVVKSVVAKYSAEELLTKRELVKGEIRNMLTKYIGEYNVIVEDVQLTSFSFSQSFDQAIEAKTTAEQLKLKAENDLARIKVEAEQNIAQAKGEAEKIRIQAQAIQNQGGKEYVMLKAIEKWKGDVPQYMGGNAPIPFLNLK